MAWGSCGGRGGDGGFLEMQGGDCKGWVRRSGVEKMGTCMRGDFWSLLMLRDGNEMTCNFVDCASEKAVMMMMRLQLSLTPVTYSCS